MSKCKLKPIPQLDARLVNPILKRFGFKLPENVQRRRTAPGRAIARWHLGYYYGYGEKDLWIPLNEYGGMATKAFHEHTVKFPKRIDTALRKLLDRETDSVRAIRGKLAEANKYA